MEGIVASQRWGNVSEFVIEKDAAAAVTCNELCNWPFGQIQSKC